jgi:SecD/SecF fusion protein
LLRRNVPKELYWLLVTVALIGISCFFVVKNPFHLGLDINGGERAVLQAVHGPNQDVDSATIIKVITNRINASGVSEAVVQPKGTDQFIIELPNVRNKDAIINQLEATAQLEFYYGQNFKSERDPDGRFTVVNPSDNSGNLSFTDASTGRTFRDQAQILKDFQVILQNSLPRAGATVALVPPSLNSFAPSGQSLYLTAQQSQRLNALGQELDDYNGMITSLGAPIMTGADIKSNATAGLGGQTGGPVVDMNTTTDGTTKLGDFSSAHVGELMAIILDGRVLSCANIREPILDGTCEISGGFATVSEAQTLANFLNAGALPMPLKIIEVESVEATLGPSAVHASLLAGAIGLGAVLVFMAGYYLLPGLLADVALIIYALFTLAVFKGALGWLGLPFVTLTLPGIAGFILSVGMAVDANILIFERLKEELRHGKSLKAAIDAGFSRAITAIRDSNICTLITCMILFSMGTASVKGFALTLGIGVLISLFTAITVTRTLLYLLVTAGAGKNLALFGLGRQWEPNFNAVKNRKVFYAISLLIIIPGIIAWFAGGLKRSIEFTGGTQVAVVYKQPTTRLAVEHALADGPQPFKENLVEMAQDSSGRSIAYISVKDMSLNAYKAVEADLTPAGQPAPFDLQSHSQVGPVISKELTSDAFQAVIIASMLIVLYLACAFSIGGFVAGLRFGASAIIALVHDVLVLIGVFSILGFVLNWQIDSLFVTALLTVVGFSVHDTIVIFDRLRENLRHRNKTESFENLANRSIQQSFARSINTSFTVVLTLVALLIFGEPSTKLLDWALLIGIVSGTYSSIFNATPILVDWEMWLARRAQANPTALPPYSAGGTAAVASPAPYAVFPSPPAGVETPSGSDNGIARPKPKKRTTPARRF